MLLNLIGNGFYAATKRLKDGAEPSFRPTLKVTTRDLGEAVEIRVRDNGTGIMPEIRDKLFQPFFTTKPTGEGTGLGLSISYDIVTQQHGGTIAVDSRVGEFTEFTIRLPRAATAMAAARQSSEQQAGRHECQHPGRRRRARCRRSVPPALSPRGAPGHLCPAFRDLGRAGARTAGRRNRAAVDRDPVRHQHAGHGRTDAYWAKSSAASPISR